MTNTLLSALSADSYRQIESDLRPVELRRGDVLVDVGDRVTHVYFVEDGAISLACVFDDGQVAEVTTIGCEGFVGVGSLLDDDTATARHTVSVPGRALAMPTGPFHRALAAIPELNSVLKRYGQYLIAQISQSVACNQMHSTHERLARWLLLAHDRASGDDLSLTHDALSEALGVRRATVTTATQDFRQNGLIDGVRGRIKILDRAGLEASACACYRIVRAEYERLLPDLQA